ncbi:Pc21g21630 [Penicillium rubens Wisconsin 54-1255]|uniref:Pc21g21630 protein n=1 Tax=Penicillium rubens (strain ATCC 28089 / DSM 1075 / NRRL 1951 / Wisconsin 54-1255) TaxID=500485 RepID=B6HM71_PENRW|nr:Pc21g21630 [Penicillium rubens Wisconsin 54-1255]
MTSITRSFLTPKCKADAPCCFSIEHPMENQNSESQPGRIIGYCFIAITPVLLCMVFVTLKLQAPRRARCEFSDSNSNNRGPGTSASYRRSRIKTLSRTALNEIPTYRTGDFPGSITRSGTPDVERGITCQQTSSSQSSRTFSPELADQNLALSRPDGSVGDSKSTCAVCSEDFMGGQLLRSLPCRHQYHAECVDGWLLNISGSCPLWYVRHGSFK